MKFCFHLTVLVSSTKPKTLAVIPNTALRRPSAVLITMIPFSHKSSCTGVSAGKKADDVINKSVCDRVNNLK